MLPRREALRGERSGIASDISERGGHLILLQSNAVKWHAFHAIHWQLCRAIISDEALPRKRCKGNFRHHPAVGDFVHQVTDIPGPGLAGARVSSST
jgi:hypothetical protein